MSPAGSAAAGVGAGSPWVPGLRRGIAGMLEADQEADTGNQEADQETGPANQQLLLSYQWLTICRSQHRLPQGQFWWFRIRLAAHRQQGANLQHRRGGTQLPNTREQGGAPTPEHLLLVRKDITADDDRWPGR